MSACIGAKGGEGVYPIMTDTEAGGACILVLSKLFLPKEHVFSGECRNLRSIMNVTEIAQKRIL